MAGGLGRIDRWAAAGIITSEQAEAIRRFEAEELRRAETGRGRVPLVTEALGYLGAALAFAALAAALAQTWNDMAVGLRAAIPIVCTVLLFAGGLALWKNPEPAFVRFGSALWFLSVAAFGWFLFVLMKDVVVAEENAALVTGIGTLAYGGILYAMRRWPLQQLAVLGGAMLAAGGLAQRLGGGDGGNAWIGVALWVVGVAWLVLAGSGVLVPRFLGYGLGAVVVLEGSQIVTGMASGSVVHLGLLLGLVTSAVLVAASIWLRENVLLIFGAIGLFGFLLGTIAHYFGETLGAPLVMLAAGLILLAVAVMTMRLRRFTGRAENA
jgi:hypothetical protein